MTNWTDLLMQRHNRYYAADGAQLVLTSPLLAPSAAVFQRVTGYQWSEEFFDLYSHHDGVGIVFPGAEIVWQFIPSSMFHDFSTSIRDWFGETHPDIAMLFHPFFDWGSGDAMGYLDLPDISMGTLVEFEHEMYEFDADQPWSEFLKPAHDSIADFLRV